MRLLDVVISAFLLLLFLQPLKAEVADTRCANLNGHEAVRKEIRTYVLFSYRNLANDILLGDGLYLENLHYMFGCHYLGATPFSKKVRELLLIYQGIPEFSREVAKLYGR